MQSAGSKFRRHSYLLRASSTEKGPYSSPPQGYSSPLSTVCVWRKVRKGCLVEYFPYNPVSSSLKLCILVTTLPRIHVTLIYTLTPILSHVSFGMSLLQQRGPALTSSPLSSVKRSSIDKISRNTSKYVGANSPSKLWRVRCLRSIGAISVDATV